MHDEKTIEHAEAHQDLARASRVGSTFNRDIQKLWIVLLELCDDLGQTDIRPASVEVARDQFSRLLRDTRKEAHLLRTPGKAKDITSRLASAGQNQLNSLSCHPSEA